jgi:hypothetical protein
MSSTVITKEITQDVGTHRVLVEKEIGDEGHIVSLRKGDKGFYLLLMRGIRTDFISLSENEVLQIKEAVSF